MIGTEPQPSVKLSRSQRIGWWLGLILALVLFLLNAYASFDVAMRHLRDGPDAVGILFLTLPPAESGFVVGGALVALITHQPGLALRWSFQSLAYLVGFDLVVAMVYVYAYGIV